MQINCKSQKVGDSDGLYVDRDCCKIAGVKEGLHQYYDIEKVTDCYSLNTVRVMVKIGLKDRINFYIKYMRPLLDSGKLQMTIPEKPNTKNQKYIINSNKGDKNGF